MLAVVGERLRVEGLANDLELLLEELSVRVLIEERPAERLDLTSLVAAADAEDDSAAGEDVGHGVVLREPERVPRRQDVERAAQLEPLGLAREPGVEEDQVGEDLVALALEVVLCRPEAVEAELVHQLRQLLRRLVRLDQPLVWVPPLVRRLPIPADVFELDMADVED